MSLEFVRILKLYKIELTNEVLVSSCFFGFMYIALLFENYVESYCVSSYVFFITEQTSSVVFSRPTVYSFLLILLV